MMQPTAEDFDLVLSSFYAEMDFASQERIAELKVVIDILLKEKESRGL